MAFEISLAILLFSMALASDLEEGNGRRKDVSGKPAASGSQDERLKDARHHAVVLLILGNDLFKRGQYLKASEKYRESVELFPTSAGYFNNALSLMMGGEFQQAKTLAGEGLAFAKKEGNRKFRRQIIQLLRRLNVQMRVRRPGAVQPA